MRWWPKPVSFLQVKNAYIVSVVVVLILTSQWCQKILHNGILGILTKSFAISRIKKSNIFRLKSKLLLNLMSKFTLELT